MPQTIRRPAGVTVLAATFVMIAALLLLLTRLSIAYIPYSLSLISLLIAYGLYKGINGIRVILAAVCAIILFVLLSVYALGALILVIVFAVPMACIIYYLTRRNVGDFFMARKGRISDTAVSLVAAALILFIIIVGLSSACAGCSGQRVVNPIIAEAGYMSYTPAVLSTNGNISFIIGQATGSAEFNIGMACTANQIGNGLPDPPNAMVYLGMEGNSIYINATSVNADARSTGSVILESGETMNVKGLKCFDSSGKPITNMTVGQAFSGHLWINYTSEPGIPNSTNPMYSTTVATLNIKVT